MMSRQFAALVLGLSLVIPFTAPGQVLPQQGGTGYPNSGTDDSVLLGEGGAFREAQIPDCPDSAGQHLNYTQSTNLFACGVSGAVGTDTIGTDELDDGADVPVAGECLKVPADTSKIEYSSCGAAGHGDGANCAAGNYPLGVDAAGAVQSCTADDDQPDDDSEVPDAITIDNSSSGWIILEQGITPGNTTEGRIQWDTATSQLAVGNGSSVSRFTPSGSAIAGKLCAYDGTAGEIDCITSPGIEIENQNISVATNVERLDFGTDFSCAPDGSGEVDCSLNSTVYKQGDTIQKADLPTEAMRTDASRTMSAGVTWTGNSTGFAGTWDITGTVNAQNGNLAIPQRSSCASESNVGGVCISTTNDVPSIKTTSSGIQDILTARDHRRCQLVTWASSQNSFCTANTRRPLNGLGSYCVDNIAPRMSTKVTIEDAKFVLYYDLATGESQTFNFQSGTGSIAAASDGGAATAPTWVTEGSCTVTGSSGLSDLECTITGPLTWEAGEFGRIKVTTGGTPPQTWASASYVICVEEVTL